jgi:WD40 repeat protein
MAAIFFMHLIQAVLAARDSLRIAIQLMTALEIALDNKLNYLLAFYTHMQNMEASMKNRVEETVAVTLNLRGTLFVVDTQYLDSIFFHALIYSDPDPIRGHYFIDRSFEGFDRIVNAMRGEELSYEGLNDYELQCIDANLNYFRLPYPRFKRIFTEFEKVANLSKELHPFTSCLRVLQDGRLCIGVSNGVIKIFNNSTFECEMELQCHRLVIWAIFQLDDGRLCTTSVDYKIKIWNLSSRECEATLVGHTEPIPRIVQYSSTHVCSGSRDNTIKLWNISTGTCEKSIPINGRFCVLELLPNCQIACLSYDGHLLFWNAETDYSFRFNLIDDKEEDLVVREDDEIYENDENVPSFAMTQLASGDLCIGSNESTEITIWDYKTHQKIKTITIDSRLPAWDNLPSVMSISVLRDDRLAVCVYFQRSEQDDTMYYAILIYNLETGECEQVLDDAYAYHVAQLSDGRLCTSFHSIVTIWK